MAKWLSPLAAIIKACYFKILIWKISAVGHCILSRNNRNNSLEQHKKTKPSVLLKFMQNNILYFIVFRLLNCNFSSSLSY